MSVNQHRNRSDRDTSEAMRGRHRIKSGLTLPGFPRVGGTREAYTVEAILRRNNRRVLSVDEAAARGGTEVGS